MNRAKALAGVAVAVGLLSAPAAADSRRHGHKELDRDGLCTVERTWKRNGDYKETRNSRGGPPAFVQAPPVPVAPFPAYAEPADTRSDADVFFAPMPKALAAAPRGSYEVTPPPAWDRGGRVCREYRTVVVVDGRPETVKGTACQQPDGRWRVAR